MQLRQASFISAALFFFAGLSLPAFADVVNSGGGLSTGGGVNVLQSIGEPIIGLGIGGSVTVHAGFIATLGNAELRVSTTTLNFGSVSVGAGTNLQLTIFNDGASSHNITALTGLPSQGFSLVSPPSLPATINGGSSLNLTVRFAPSSPGAVQSSLGIATNDSSAPNFSITLKGTGTPVNAPAIRLSPATVPFGSVLLGQFANQNLTIFNDGTATLTVNGFSGLPSDGFTINSAPGVPFNIAGGGSQVISLRFTPASTGAHGATLHVTSNDSSHPDVTAGLTGTGTSNGSCFIDNIPVSAAAGLDLGGFLASVKVKHSKTGTTKISGKLTINQLRLADLPTSPTLGVPIVTVGVYLLDQPDPCSLAQLPAPLFTVTTKKAGKPGKPGLPAKGVKVKLSTVTGEQTTSRSLLIVIDPDNAILETDKSNNFVVSQPPLL